MFRHDLAPRIFFDEPVELRIVSDDGNSSTISGRALNVSIGGMFVRAYITLEPDAQVQLRFLLPTGVVVHAEATVLRATPGSDREPGGMALRFDALEQTAGDELDRFIEDRLRPANGETVRLQLGKTKVRARAQASWGNVISVDAELPFLKLGSNVQLSPGDEPPGGGQIRWVAVHVCPDTGVPRLNIGIELEESADEALPQFDEVDDPVHTPAFLEHAKTQDRELRAARKAERSQRSASA